MSVIVAIIAVSIAAYNFYRLRTLARELNATQNALVTAAATTDKLVDTLTLRIGQLQVVARSTNSGALSGHGALSRPQ